MAGRLATQHLIERRVPHRIVFLGNTQAIEPSLRLGRGEVAAIDSRHDIMLVDTPTHFDVDVSGSDIDDFLSQTDAQPDGIFAASDLIALTAIQVLAEPRGVGAGRRQGRRL